MPDESEAVTLADLPGVVLVYVVPSR